MTKINKEQVGWLANMTGVNVQSPQIDLSIKSVNVTLKQEGVGSTDTAGGSVYEFLIDPDTQCDVENYIDRYKEERDGLTYNGGIEIESFLDDVDHTLPHKVNVPKIRVKTGFDVGFIDHVNGALLKTSEGWADQDMKHILPANASIEDVERILSNVVNLVPTYTVNDLIKAEEEGYFYYNNEIRACKDNSGNWHDLKNVEGHDKKFNDGDIIRLLHHSDMELFIQAGAVTGEIYHGNVTNSPKPEINHILRTGSSKQGDAVYGTSSVNEAVKVYGNPKSFEMSGKLLTDHNKRVIDKKDFVFGHLYEITSSANVYVANQDNMHLDMNKVPSLPAILLLAKASGASEVYSLSCWLRMKSAESSFDVYAAANDFCNTVIRAGGSANTFNQIFAGMGFDGIDVTFPGSQVIEQAGKAIESLKKTDEDLFTSKGVRKSALVSRAESYLKYIVASIPAKGEARHLIVFDQNLIEKKHIKLLPFNNALLNKDDDFYNSEDPLTLEVVLSAESPDFDGMKRFWSEKEDLVAPSVSFG